MLHVHTARECGICGHRVLHSHHLDPFVVGVPMTDKPADDAASHLTATIGPYSFQDLVRAIERDNAALQATMSVDDRSALLANLLLSARALGYLLADHVIPGAARELARHGWNERDSVVWLQRRVVRPPADDPAGQR